MVETIGQYLTRKIAESEGVPQSMIDLSYIRMRRNEIYLASKEYKSLVELRTRVEGLLSKL